MFLNKVARMESAQAGINIILKHPKRIIRTVQRKDRTMAMQSQINANVQGVPQKMIPCFGGL